MYFFKTAVFTCILRQVQLHSAAILNFSFSKGKKFGIFFSNQKYYIFKLKVFQIVIYCACYLWHRKDHKTFDFILGIYFIILFH